MLLSVCIPTYNRAKSLANCLNSIKIAQKFVCNTEVEVCISDNASDDNTKEIVQRFQKDIKIKYLRNKNYSLEIICYSKKIFDHNLIQ